MNINEAAQTSLHVVKYVQLQLLISLKLIKIICCGFRIQFLTVNTVYFHNEKHNKFSNDLSENKLYFWFYKSR